MKSNRLLWSNSVWPPQASIEPLRRALTHRSNYIVAKAADLVREFRLPELIPELLVAFDRCFTDLVRTESPHAEAAIEAILRSMPSAKITSQLESMVSGNPRLARAFATHRAASS